MGAMLSLERPAARRWLGTLWLSAMPTLAVAQANFLDLDIKELLSLEITSASKKPQTLSQAAAAVFVITGDDIRRSGVRTIPDALRMAPGIQVGQITANSWGVSSRGFDGRFTNKLLVMIDGRSVYSPSFSGVYWDVQDTPLEDVDRIEVIRGPGATLWGANAVNGVINIITRSAASSQGATVAVGVGSDERGSLAVRYGGRFGEAGFWRASVKGFNRDGSQVAATGEAGGDAWRQRRAGFRADFAPSSRDSVTVQGDVYTGRAGEDSVLNFLAPPYSARVLTTQDVSGSNVLGRWQRDLSASDSFTLQAYVDHTRRDWPARIDERRTTRDVDFQYRTRRFEGHDIVAGLGYRSSSDTLVPATGGLPPNTLHYFVFDSASGAQRWASAFFQDDVALVPARLTLTLGGKIEKSNVAGAEFQPNARLLWAPDDSTTIWGSLARAARTPARADAGGILNQAVLPPRSASNPAPVPLIASIVAKTGSETLTAYEMGVKHRFSSSLSADLSVYSNRYSDLRSGRAQAPHCLPSRAPAPACLFALPPFSAIGLEFVAGNEASARARGLELVVDWRPRADLRVQAAATVLSMKVHAPEGSDSADQAGSTPARQASLRLAWNPRPDTDLDLWLRRVGAVPDPADGIRNPNSARVSGYTEIDLRLAWRPTPQVEFELVGRNLVGRTHREFISELGDLVPMAIERSWFGKMTWRF